MVSNQKMTECFRGLLLKGKLIFFHHFKSDINIHKCNKIKVGRIIFHYNILTKIKEYIWRHTIFMRICL